MQPTKLVGTSPSILNLQEEIFYAAKCDAKVLDHGRERGGQGDRRAPDSRRQSTQPFGARHRQLRGAVRDAPRDGALWSRARQLHWRLSRSAGGVRTGAPRHGLHGRDRGDQPADAGSAAAVSRDRRNPARRFRSGSEPRRCSRHRRDQPRSGGQRRQQDVSRGSRTTG